ncbi:MAG: PQQ-binding-like beta-propeller repeat protein, partial [Planctomycetota bacterium]
SGPDTVVDFRLACLVLETGKSLWSKSIAKRKPQFAIHPSNTYATESPACDGERVYTYFGGIGLVAAFDLNGEKTWTADIGAVPTGAGFGSGSSLAVAGHHVFVQCDNDKSSFLVAFDGKTGKEAWRKKRSGRTSWSTPLTWQSKSGVQLIVCGAGSVVSHDPKSGDVNWELKNLSSSFSSSPAADSERVYFGSSGPRRVGPLYAIPADAKGVIDAEEWKQDENRWSVPRSGPGLASPVEAGGYVYVIRRSILSCFNSKTGERIYRERLPKARSVAASLWADKDRVFLLDERGTTYVVKAGPKFELLATNRIDDLFWSTPAVTGDALLLRGTGKIYCIRKSAPEEKKTTSTALR